MTAYRVIGIDPALTHTGIVVLESEKVGAYGVTAAQTICTNSRQLILDRLCAIRDGVGEFMDVQAHRWNRAHSDVVSILNPRFPVQAVVIEDPSSRSGPAARAVGGKNPRSILLLGMAVGVILGRFNPKGYPNGKVAPPALLTPDEWMPKVRSGNLTHIIPRAQIMRYLVGRIQFPEGEPSEHVIMAAGVARYWIEQQRLSERKAAR